MLFILGVFVGAIVGFFAAALMAAAAGGSRTPGIEVVEVPRPAAHDRLDEPAVPVG